MGDVHYMISEAARQLGVESHVLRYWEEELELPIGRTEMGHRHYTEEDIQLFSCIKELKEQGMQLREIKDVIPDLLRTKKLLKNKHENTEQPARFTTDQFIQGQAAKEHSIPEPTSLPFQAQEADMHYILTVFEEVLQDVLTQNNQVLEDAICQNVSDKVSKNMDFLFQAKERQEEDRYRRLDHLIRQQQISRRESARLNPSRYLHKLFSEN